MWQPIHWHADATSHRAQSIRRTWTRSRLNPEQQPRLSLTMWPGAGDHDSLSFSFPLLLLSFGRGRPCPKARGILVPQLGIKPAPLHWRHKVLTTRHTREARVSFYLMTREETVLLYKEKNTELDKYFLPSFFLPVNRWWCEKQANKTPGSHSGRIQGVNKDRGQFSEHCPRVRSSTQNSDRLPAEECWRMGILQPCP